MSSGLGIEASPMMRMKVVFFFIALCVLSKATEAFPSMNENDGTGHDREKRDLQTDLNTLGIEMDDTYKKAHSECMALPSCAVILAKADKELTKIVKGAIAGKAVQDWFNTAQKTNAIQDIAKANKKINTFLASQSSYIELLERHDSNPVLSVVDEQVVIVKESFQNVDDANQKVLNKFDILLLPKDANFNKRIGDWGRGYQGPAAKLKKYFEAPDQYMREKVKLTQKDYLKAKGAHFTILDMITGYSKQKNESKMCDLMLPSSNRTSVIQVFLALYNSMVVSARNTLLIGQITGQNDLCEFKEDLKGCLEEASKEITKCLTAVDGGQKAAAKRDTPDYTDIYDDNDVLKGFEAENEGNKDWLEIYGKLTELNDDHQAGDIADQYKNHLVNCVSDTKANGCKAKMEVKLQASDKATNAERISNALDSGSTLTSQLAEILTGNKKINGRLLTAIVTNFGPFLGALGPMAGIIGTFSDSPEVQLLNQVLGTINKGFERIENKLEVIGHALEEIHRKIDQSQFYEDIRTKGRDPVVLLKTDVDLLLYNQPKTRDGEVDVESLKSSRDELMADKQGHMSDAKDALTILYKMFTGKMPDLRTSPPWCQRVRSFSDDHRNEVMTLTMEYFKIWLTGAQSYLFTLELMGDAKRSSETIRLEDEAKEIMTEIGKCEERIMGAWEDRWTRDALTWAQKGGKNDAGEIADAIYQGVTDKYYWRDWLVVVYSKDTDYTHINCMADYYTTSPPTDARLVHKCADNSYHLDHGSWQVHVVNVAGDKPKIPNLEDISYIKTGQRETYAYVHSHCYGNGYTGTVWSRYFNPDKAITIFNRFPDVVKDDKGKCTKFVSSGVVRAQHFAARGKGDRMKSFRRGTAYEEPNWYRFEVLTNGWYFG